jgi:hypothetical protein
LVEIFAKGALVPEFIPKGLGMSAVVVSATLVSAGVSFMIFYPKFYREYYFKRSICRLINPFFLNAPNVGLA